MQLIFDLNIKKLKDQIVQMEYGFNKQTFLILIPVISQIFQKIQISHILQNLNTNNQRITVNNKELVKIDSICKWHALGNIIQITSICCISLFHPLSIFFLLLPIYGLYLSSKSVVHVISSSGNSFNIRR